jgi:hypothetical protein
MLLIGCDYHPSVQQIAMVDTGTGDYSEHGLKHSDGEEDLLVLLDQLNKSVDELSAAVQQEAENPPEARF